MLVLILKAKPLSQIEREAQEKEDAQDLLEYLLHVQSMIEGSGSISYAITDEDYSELLEGSEDEE